MRLTRRQWEIVRLVVQGKSSYEIARDLGISYSTVKNHLLAIYGRTHIHGRLPLIQRYWFGRRPLTQVQPAELDIHG